MPCMPVIGSRLRQGSGMAGSPAVLPIGLQAHLQGDVSTMSAIDVQCASPSALSQRVALVRAQLAPISTRSALLDSYRRESLCRLTADSSPGSAVDVLERAYAMRWAELGSDTPMEPTADDLADLADG